MTFAAINLTLCTQFKEVLAGRPKKRKHGVIAYAE
jgi:hypothetical protein